MPARFARPARARHPAPRPTGTSVQSSWRKLGEKAQESCCCQPQFICSARAHPRRRRLAGRPGVAPSPGAPPARPPPPRRPYQLPPCVGPHNRFRLRFFSASLLAAALLLGPAAAGGLASPPAAPPLPTPAATPSAFTALAPPAAVSTLGLHGGGEKSSAAAPHFALMALQTSAAQSLVRPPASPLLKIGCSGGGISHKHSGQEANV